MADLTPQARERANRTIIVAQIFAEHAEQIAEAVTQLPDEHVLVAVIDHNHEFTGLHEVDKTNLVERVVELEGPGGWAMVFSPGADPDHVRGRTSEMADIAGKRISAIDRIRARQAAAGSE
jgi:hypothetical protein